MTDRMTIRLKQKARVGEWQRINEGDMLQCALQRVLQCVLLCVLCVLQQDGQRQSNNGGDRKREFGRQGHRESTTDTLTHTGRQTERLTERLTPHIFTLAPPPPPSPPIHRLTPQERSTAIAAGASPFVAVRGGSAGGGELTPSLETARY